FRCGAAAAAHSHAVPGDPEGSDRAPLSERVLGQSCGGNLRRRGLGGAGLNITGQVRLGHRLAQLHQAAGAGEHSNQNRPASFHGTDRGPVLASWASLRRRPGPDGAAVLHEFRVSQIHPGGPARGRGLRPVFEVIQGAATALTGGSSTTGGGADICSTAAITASGCSSWTYWPEPWTLSIAKSCSSVLSSSTSS